jgi:hypothetical protein
MPRASPETMINPLGELDAGGGGVARADQRDHVCAQHLGLAAHAEERRRVVDHPESRRIAGLAQRHERNAEPRRGFDLALGFGHRTDAPGSGRAAAAGQFWQRVERGAGGAVVIEQGAEGAGTDILAADQLQPVEPLPVREPHPGFR